MESFDTPHQDRRVVKTKKTIKRALAGLLKQKDIHQITIKELADAADINRKTFYTHYQSLEDVLSEIESELISSLQEIVHGSDLDNGKQTLYDIFIKLNNLISENFDFYNQLVRLDSSAFLTKKIKNIFKGAVLSDSDLNINIDHRYIDFLVEYVTSGIMAMYTEWFYSDRKMPIEELAEIAANLSYNSISVLVNK